MTRRDKISNPASFLCWTSFEFYVVLLRKELKQKWVSDEFLCDKTGREFTAGQKSLLAVF